MLTMTITKGRRSVKLTTEEKRSFRKWVEKQVTKLDAAEIIGIAPNTLDRILLAGSGKPDTIAKVRLKIAS